MKSYHVVDYRGGSDTGKYKANADYDRRMIMNVLHYAEPWPFMLGAPVTESAARSSMVHLAATRLTPHGTLHRHPASTTVGHPSHL
ncbi:hypothetical protein PG997_003040 [Apiospora hydei]|uniref:Uncharacterized protein n=1 Tax=Apiospora hydei TaxID=1337664 RepID=A0ABR1WY51_9PEZI